MEYRADWLILSVAALRNDALNMAAGHLLMLLQMGPQPWHLIP